MSLKELLIELNACDEANGWVSDKNIEDAVKEVERGDWLLWLAKKIDIPIKPLTLAKARCAKTVIHLMKDQRSIDAVNLAEKYGLTDEISDDDLKNAAADAYYAADAAAAYDAAAAAYYAADAAAYYAASADAYYAASADAAAYYAASAAAAKTKNQLQTAYICREILGELIINRVNELLK